jgi:hypothetical protein
VHTGVETAKELHIFLKARGKVEEYPLFTFVVRTVPPATNGSARADTSLCQYRAAYEGVRVDELTAHI